MRTFAAHFYLIKRENNRLRANMAWDPYIYRELHLRVHGGDEHLKKLRHVDTLTRTTISNALEVGVVTLALIYRPTRRRETPDFCSPTR